MRCQTMLLVAQADNLSIVIHGPIPWYGSSAQIEAWKTVRQPDRAIGRKQSKIRKFETVAITDAQHPFEGSAIGLSIHVDSALERVKWTSSSQHSQSSKSFEVTSIIT
jgi:hypothetical protein